MTTSRLRCTRSWSTSDPFVVLSNDWPSLFGYIPAGVTTTDGVTEVRTDPNWEGDVLVRFQNSDGLVFLATAKPAVTIDAGALTEDDRRALEQLVMEARFFDLPARISAERGAPDSTCHITIEAGGRRHSVFVSGPVQGPALRRLIDRLRELGDGTKSGVTESGVSLKSEI